MTFTATILVQAIIIYCLDCFNNPQTGPLPLSRTTICFQHKPDFPIKSEIQSKVFSLLKPLQQLSISTRVKPISVQ